MLESYKCPYCGKTPQIPETVYINSKHYQRSNLSVTKCCGNILKVIPYTRFTYHKVRDDIAEDDWGNEKQIKND